MLETQPPSLPGPAARAPWDPDPQLAGLEWPDARLCVPRLRVRSRLWRKSTRNSLFPLSKSGEGSRLSWCTAPCPIAATARQAGSLSASLRVVSVSLRRHYPERWNGVGDDFSTRQHYEDVVAFIDANRYSIDPSPKEQIF